MCACREGPRALACDTMLRSFPLLLLLVGVPALASDSRGGPVSQACQRAHLACRDDCAVDWGASMSQRARLNHCFKGCDRDESTCRERALLGPGAKKAPATPYREEKPRSRYAAPERKSDPGRAAKSEQPARAGGSGSKAPPPLNVGAPDWLDDSGSKKKTMPAQAASPKGSANGSANASATTPAPEGAAPSRAPSGLPPLPSLPPAAKDAPLEDAPLDELHQAEKDPLDSGTFEDDASFDEEWAAPAPPSRPSPAPAPAPSRSATPVDLAEAEELLPLDDGFDDVDEVPAKPASRELPSGGRDTAAPQAAPAKSATPAKSAAPAKDIAPTKPAPKKSTFGKKRDISDWDPN